jgi:hypothetical protein
VVAAVTTTIRTNGRLDLNGGTFTTGSFSSQGQFNWTSGTLHVGTYTGNLTNSAGVLAPGQSAGSTTVSGNYTQQAAAALQIEVGGTLSATQYDAVYVTGSTTLGGNLQVGLINDYIPSSASTFIVLNSVGSVSGSFINVSNGERLLTTDGIGTFVVRYGASSTINTKQVVLTDFAIAGDFNGDSTVDAADFVYWQHSRNATVNRFSGADGNGNGLVDDADYVVWRSHFGLTSTASALSALAAVPEPAALFPSLMLMSVLVAQVRTRK